MNPTVPNSTEWGPVQCNFYHHTRANTSDLFVSHRTTDTVGQMLVSLIKGDLLTSAPSKQLPVFGNTVHKAPSAATGKAERGTEMPHQAALEADYSCVDMEGKWKDASKLGSSVPRSAEAQEASVPTPLSPLALVSRTETTAAEDAEGSHSQKALPPSSLPISDVDVSSSDSAACSSPLPTRVPQYDSLAPMSPSQGELASLRCWQWTAPRHTVDSSFVRRQLTLLAYRRVVALLNPHTLACGSYISMFSSGAEYSRLTQCFRAVAVAKKDVVSSWVSLAHCAALCILLPRTMDEKVQLTMALTGNAVPGDIAAEAGNQGHIEFCRSGSKSSSGPTGPDVFARVSEAVRGVYVHRIAENAFELGVVMHGGHQDPRLLCLLQCLSHWCQVSIEHRSVVLPICASLRSVSLRLWWMPQHSRVTPGSLLPPIKALVEEDRRIVLTAKSGDVAERDDSSWRTPPGTLSAGLEEDTYPLFPSYDDVALFLARPVASQLHGTNVLPLPHSFREYIMDREWSDTSKAAGYREAGPDDATEPRNVSGCAHRPFSPASGVKKLVRLSNGVVQATLVFAETRVSTVGEHLLAAEMQPKAAYRPFVPTLCANVAPFLVVGPEEA
ncbi:conserved hypothetical protein [Leishmania braziliensis MHOM/BR/75/M2904]|uniref:Uncharacterized protein n=2 Tax=Leishmania braziliensis TaxID=5660 RepID=A4HKK7_LEIBR|nr:conserved hypothetical protein [Leishmania braziliensis MHOM/BR/75/M2904]CAJ2478686.1 unnamed protein product [Leishmania braziliensis]CAM43034.2 conserved hypothetical protein [Leishmania braziliensis MHOM/BR/75/M2904]SYZ68740.1 hypothetical_protein [Leishmania braziliensis MHOM/BR/75/M2904]